jgi:hypothetical protein
MMNGGNMKQATTARRMTAVQNYGSDASFVANLIFTQHAKPATKLRNVLYLLQRGYSVRTAQFSTDILLVDGKVMPWNALDYIERALNVVNPKY